MLFLAGVGLFSDGLMHVAGRYAVKLVLSLSVRADWHKAFNFY